MMDTVYGINDGSADP